MSRDNVFYKWGAGVGASHPKISSAHDEFLVTEDGTEIVDAASGAAVVNLGHSVPGIPEAFSRQANNVSYISLSHFTHDASERLAEQLADLAPGDLNTAFFVNSGSEANELAFKLARAFHHDTGASQKSAVIGRWQSYHGATLGALSATGNTGRRSPYYPLLNEWPHVSAAYPYRWSHEGSFEEQSRAAARELETVIRQEGAEMISAFIAEPVSGASIPAAHPHPAYFEEIREICDEYDVLFIADEVMTGFGRVGSAFACERFDVVPDIQVLGKGLSGGYTPISAVMVRDEIAAQFDSDGGSSFAHGHTHSGNPVSAAIASEVVAQYTDDIFEGTRTKGQYLHEELSTLEDHPMVGEIRQIGLMVGIEFVADRESKAPFDPGKEIYRRVFDAAMERGVYTYPGKGSADGVAGDHLMLTPPLTTQKETLSRIADVVTESVEEVGESITTRARA